MANDHAAEIARNLLDAFAAGTVPDHLAPIFLIDREAPMSSWSYRNRFLVALRKSADARGYRQWQEVGRQVRKGARALYILAPSFAKSAEPTADQEPAELRLVGFRPIPVFRLEDTDGDDLRTDPAIRQQLAELPFRDVAAAWGIAVSAVPRNGEEYGAYQPSTNTIRLATLEAWEHELLHAADHRSLGDNLTPGPEAEIVAELGAATLRVLAGLPTAHDTRNAHRYISHLAETPSAAFALASRLLERTGKAVDLILQTAQALNAAAIAA